MGRTTVAAYAAYLDETPESDYVTHLRDAARRDREAELWVAVDDDGTLLGSVTSCPEGSPWRELLAAGRGRVPDAGGGPGRAGARGRPGAGHARRRPLPGAGLRPRVVICSMTSMEAAHRVYLGLGFTRDPALDWSPVPGVDLIAFRLDLEE